MARLIDEHVNCSCGRDIAATLDGDVDGATLTIHPQGLAPVAVHIDSDLANALVDAEAEAAEGDADDADDLDGTDDGEAAADAPVATPAAQQTPPAPKPRRPSRAGGGG